MQLIERTLERINYCDAEQMTKPPDVSIKSATGDNGRVSGAPLHVKGPLRGERHLVEDLATLNIGVGIPAEDTIVLAAR